MTTPLVYQVPLQLKLTPTAYGPSSTSIRGAITLTCRNTVTNHSLYFPSANANGMLFNDGLGNLRWVNPSTTSLGVQNVTVNTNDNFGVIKINQLSTGACSILYNSPTAIFNMGIDQNDSSTFKLSQSTTLGALDIIKFSLGALTIPANLVMSETQQSGTSGSFTMGTCKFYALNSSNNLFIGSNAGNLSFTTATDNVALGKNCLSQLTTGLRNTMIGNLSGVALTTGNDNIGVGYNSLTSLVSGLYNTAMGNYSLYNQVLGNYNAAFGRDALFNATADRNVGVGYKAGYWIFSGTDNVCIGYNANPVPGTFNNTIIIGSGSLVSASNTCQLGNASIANFGFGPKSLTTNQLGQLVNLPDSPSVLLSASSWTSLAGIDQQLNTTSSPMFAGLTVTGTANIETANIGYVNIVTISSSVATYFAATVTLTTLNSIVRANAVSNPMVLTLPLSSAKPSQEIKIVKVDSTTNVVSVVPQGSDTIDYDLTQFDLVHLKDAIHLVNMGDGCWKLF